MRERSGDGMEPTVSESPPICRCERVSLAEIETARRLFAPTSLRELKLVTRATMGICQGRVCQPVLEALAAAWFPTVKEPLASRPPLRPVALAALAAWEPEP